MARIRSHKPEFWTNEQVMASSRDARLALFGMKNFCDDWGIHPASYKTLKAEVFPGDEDLSSADVKCLVDELIANGLLEMYEVEGSFYWLVMDWHDQRIDQPTYKYPRPDGTVPEGVARRRADRQQANKMKVVRQPFGEQSANSRRVVGERSPQEGNGRERSGHGKGDENHVAQPALLPPAPSAGSPESGRVLNRDGVEPDADKLASLLATPSPAKPAKRINSGVSRFKERFDEFWDVFAYKNGKIRAMQAWEKLGKDARHDEDLEALADKILRAAEIEARRRQTFVASSRTPIYPEGWLSQRRFEDEELLGCKEAVRKGAAPEDRGEFVGGLL